MTRARVIDGVSGRAAKRERQREDVGLRHQKHPIRPRMCLRSDPTANVWWRLCRRRHSMLLARQGSLFILITREGCDVTTTVTT
jgi:hypothetical protein